MEVRIDGAVAMPGLKQLHEHARLSDAALATPLRPDAYPLGASWQRLALRPEQVRLKAGLMFDLNDAHRQALLSQRPVLANAIATLQAWVRTMPVTGRQIALLDPRAIEINAAENWPIADGDVVYYPGRPSTIRAVGAVVRACELPLIPLQDARNYLDDCKPSQAADGDWIYIIQPDGRVVKQGVRLWNTGHALALAPGAVIYVPLRETGAHAVPPELNRELAAFLATQPLSATEGEQ